MSLRWEYLHKFFGILLPRDLFNFSPVIYLSDCFYIYIGSWIFILYFGLSSDSALFCCVNCFRFGRWKCFLLNLGSPVCTQQCGFLFVSFLLRLLSCMMRGSRLLLYISCLSPSIHHFSNPLFLLGENSIENQDLSAGCACCCRSVVASWPSQLTEEGNICVSTHSRIQTYL